MKDAKAMVIYLERRNHGVLRRLAKTDGVPMAELIRKVLDLYIEARVSTKVVRS